ncbi:MAG: hypothetical protein P8K14_00830 [Flavobacteriaceae bacterium]|jgi:hypothetical protein|nr:hypothetical protein [Flavobacteriaceae bacterium]
MKSFLDKYQFAIGAVIILLLVVKDALGASIYSLEVTDKLLPFWLTISLYLVGIILLMRHIYQKNKKR